MIFLKVPRLGQFSARERVKIIVAWLLQRSLGEKS